MTIQDIVDISATTSGEWDMFLKGLKIVVGRYVDAREPPMHYLDWLEVEHLKLISAAELQEQKKQARLDKQKRMNRDKLEHEFLSQIKWKGADDIPREHERIRETEQMRKSMEARER